MSLNDDLAELFANLAALMELRGENIFKVIAFQKVGRIIRDSNFDLKKCVQENTLCEIEGIGKGSQQIIEEYINSGKSTVYEEVSASVPVGLVPMLSIEGLGPKTIGLLWKQLDITSLDLLEKAIESGTLAQVKGFGAKKIATMKQGIDAYRRRVLEGGGAAPVRTGIPKALAYAVPLLEQLRKLKGVRRAEIAGSLRRRRETIADVDFLAAVKSSDDGQAVSDAFVKLQGVVQVLGQGSSKASVKVANGLQVDLRIVPEVNFGAALLYFTGSKEHNVKVRGLALKKKMTLNEWGLYTLDAYEKAKKETARAPELKPLASKTEEEVYSALGLSFIEPELREDRGEIDASLKSVLPELITLADMRGDLHTHTTASDGIASIEEMAEAAKARGYKFLAITDHSKSQVIARGLTVERLLQNIDAVRKAGARHKGIELLIGSEVDIMADGTLDYDDDVLKQLDIVVASPHFALKQSPEKATERLLRAIENKYVNIIGHPTGRLINGREGLSPDFSILFKAAAETGTALEINASYPRLDLNELNARAAVSAGVMLSINTDAHSTDELDNMPFGINVARRAWVTKRNVINCMSIGELKKFLAGKRK
jgi:DNA polymerase (family 10)